MKSNILGRKALFVGNGINLLDKEQSISWQQLLTDIKNHFKIDVSLNNVFKPFPLAFEEMLHRSNGSRSYERVVRELKQRIRTSLTTQVARKSGYNQFHTKLLYLGYDDILTTNYDYSFEQSVAGEFLSEKKKIAGNKQEIKHSLKRCYHFPSPKVNIWHIHGELINSRDITGDSRYFEEESIMIGYEHYSEYFKKIQDNIKGRSGRQKVDNQSLLSRLKGDGKSPFWTDIFFTHNLDILGIGLDFSEHHLWWLLNHRANLIYRKSSEVEINNRIRFFYPLFPGRDKISNKYNFDELIKAKNEIEKSVSVADILKAFKIETIAVKTINDSYEEFYEIVIDDYLGEKSRLADSEI